MPLPFDATLKDLVRSHVHDFEVQFDLSGPAPVSLLNVDLSTLTAATDQVLGYGDPPRQVIDIQFQSGRDEDLLPRVFLYQAVLYHRYRVPVHSVVLLLRPAANDAQLDQGLHLSVWPERARTDLRCEVVRLWQRPVEGVLRGGVGTLPLAPLCRMPGDAPPAEALPGIIQQIQGRLLREAPPEEARRLLTATFVLSGLKVPRAVAIQLFQGVQGMRESSTYQYILDEGRLEEARKLLLTLGGRRFGPADQAVTTQVSGITDLERLERMADRLLEAGNWQELLQTP